MHDFLPAPEAELLTFAGNMSQLLSGNPQRFGATPELALELAGRLASFQHDFTLANNRATDTGLVRAEKQLSKRALREQVRRVARVVRAMCTDESALAELGLRPADAVRSRPGAPREAPLLRRIVNEGTRLTVVLGNRAAPSRRRRPPGTIGAVIYAHAGPPPSARFWDWQVVLHTSEMEVTVDLDESVTPGSMAWVSACWVGPRLQLGPTAYPSRLNVAGSILAHATDAVHLAA